MNAKTEQWESYTDDVGRRHWRWPAAKAQMGATRLPAEAGARYSIGLPERQQQAQRPPAAPKGK